LSGRSAAWLARLVRDQEVDGSNPFAPTNFLLANQALTATAVGSSLGSIAPKVAGTSKPTPHGHVSTVGNIDFVATHTFRTPPQPKLSNAFWAMGVVPQECVAITTKSMCSSLLESDFL
jgi:hypothetical protein